MEKKVRNGTIRLELGDITDMEVEAFVYDITADVQLGSGYGGAIAVRGGKSIQEELDSVGSCPTGTAVITSGGNLKAKHIIHVNGPKFHEPDTEAKLRAATRAALDKASENGIGQIAFPPIGTGLYQVPLDLCARVMIDTVAEYLGKETSLKDVTFVALDERELAPLRAKLEEGV